jgi:hypothetical protein
MGGIRDYVYDISPPWLQSIIANKLLYVPGLGVDLLCEKRDQGNLLAMPGYGDPSGLPFIGKDRNIGRGLNESVTSYAARLQQAWDDWGFAGSPRAVLRQTLTYILPSQPQALTVNDSGNWDNYPPNADTTLPPSHSLVSPTNWNWDGVEKWWRCFLIFFSVSPNAFCIGEGTWGDGDVWGDATKSWGLSIPASEVTSIRSILAQWKAQHAWFPYIIISFDATWFQPSLPVGDPKLPDGTWGRWGKVVTISGTRVYVRSRSSVARYAKGAL